MEKHFRRLCEGYITVKLIFEKINFSGKYEDYGHYF